MTDNTPPAFRLENLTHTYPNGAVALAGLTTALPAGVTTAVLGPSGSGKSTLLSLLGLLWDGPGPAGGLWFSDGKAEHDLLRLGADDKAALRAAAFGFVLQSSYLLPHFNCLQNVAMPLALHGWPSAARDRWAAALLEADGVDPRRDLREKSDSPPRTASLGQRQRFAVLRAVVADPAVVFADEPSSNLDPGGTRAMLGLLARWKAGELFTAMRKHFASAPSTPPVVSRWLAGADAGHRPRTLVLVCHDVQTARANADRFLVLNQQHAVEVCFEKAEWNAHAQAVERVLGLPPGAAGRDEE